MAEPAFIPFAQFTPDGGRLRNPGLLNADNCAPLYGEGFVPLSTVNRVLGTGGAIIAANPQDSIQKFTHGGACVFLPASEIGPLSQHYYKVFLGTRVGIAGQEDESEITEWKVAGDGSFSRDNHSPLAGGETVQGEGWFFQVYGNSVVAVAGWDVPPKIYIDATDDGTGFVDLWSGSSPQEPYAKFVASMGLHLLLANIKLGSDEFPNRVWWSATDDVRYYSDGTTNPEQRSDFQDLNDEYGAITGIIGGADYAYIAKERCWYRMVEGGPFDFTLKPFGMGMGTIYGHSICKFGDTIFYWSKYGPARIRPGLEPEPLGEGLFLRSVQDGSWVLSRPLGLTASHPAHLLNAVVDEENGLVCWAYNARNALNEEPEWLFNVDTLFIYNPRHNRGADQVNWFEDSLLNENGKDALTAELGAGFQVDPDGDYPSTHFLTVPFFVPNQPLLQNAAVWAPLLRVHWAILTKGWEVDDTGTWTNVPVWSYAYGDNTAAPPCRFRTGFVRLDEAGADTKVNKVRVVFSTNIDGQRAACEVRVSSLRIPSDPPLPDANNDRLKTQMDERGWYKFADVCPLAPMHQFEVRLADPVDVAEIEGIEVEWEYGGR